MIPPQCDEVAAIIRLAERGQAPEAADAQQPWPRFGRWLRGIRLDHAKHTLVCQRILHQRLVARLEDVERQLAMGQQQRTREREDPGIRPATRLERDASRPWSAEQQCRKFTPGSKGRRVGVAPCLEELQQLQAGRALVPGAVEPDDLQQRGCRFRALADSVERGCEFVSGLVVSRIGGHLAFAARPRPAAALAPSAASARALRAPLTGRHGRRSWAGSGPGPRPPAPVGRARAECAPGRPRRPGSPALRPGTALNSSPASSGRSSSSAVCASTQHLRRWAWRPARELQKLLDKPFDLAFRQRALETGRRSALAQKAATVGMDCMGSPILASCSPGHGSCRRRP